MAVTVMLEMDVPVTRRARFVRIGQLRGLERRSDGSLLVDVDLAEARNQGAHAFVTADPAGETLRPGPLPIWQRSNGRGARLGDAPPSIVDGDWLWWERLELAQ